MGGGIKSKDVNREQLVPIMVHSLRFAVHIGLGASFENRPMTEDGRPEQRPTRLRSSVSGHFRPYPRASVHGADYENKKGTRSRRAPFVL